MLNKPAIETIKMQTSNRFLNLFELRGFTAKNMPITYYAAARAESIEQYMQNLSHASNDAVSMFATTDDQQVVLIKQWRYPCNDFVIEFPAGLIDKNESIHDAAIREFKEETGFDFKPTSSNEIGYYPSVGLTNEKLVTVYGKVVGGSISKQFQETSEDIEVLLVDRDEAKRILCEEKVALNCAMILKAYFNL